MELDVDSWGKYSIPRSLVRAVAQAHMNEEHSTLSSAEQFDAIAATAYKEVAVMKGQDWKYKVVCEPCAGYRANAGICVFDSSNGKVLAFERLDHHSWQCAPET